MKLASSVPPGAEAHIQFLCEQGRIYGALDVLSCLQGSLSSLSYLSLLTACNKRKSLSLAKLLHAHLTTHSVHISLFAADFWVMTLAKCGAIDEALQVSASLPNLTVFSWTAIISAYAECGCGHEALNIHQRMLDSGIEPDKYTFVSLFKACGCIQDLEKGKKLHADARQKGITVDVFACNTLVSMYGKCGAILEAEEVFRGMSCRTRVSWNAMLSVYVDLGLAEHALLLFRQIQTEGESTNELTFVLAIQACSSLVEREPTILARRELIESFSLQIGRALHMDAQRMGYTSDILVGSTLVSMYGKCGSVPDAESAFTKLSDTNVVSWTAIISTYVDQGQGVKALQLFTEMHREGTSPNPLTYRVVLQALGTLMEEFPKQEHRVLLSVPQNIVHALHKDSNSQGYTSDACVGNMFVSLYGKCGAVCEAETVYQGLLTRDVVSCNAMLSVYIEQGYLEKASQLIKQMQVEHTSLDEVSLMYMLQLSREIGSLGVCHNVHFGIVSAGHCSAPSISATLVHAYGTCGSSVDAEMVLEEVFFVDETLRNAYVTSHAGEGNGLEALSILEKSKAAGIKTDKILLTSILSACCRTGLTVDGLEYFDCWCHQELTPDLQHYCILAGMLGRAGDFVRVENLLGNMRMQADLNMWLCLLGNCCMHGQFELASFAFQKAVNLLPEEAVAYVLMRNLCNYSWGEQSWSGKLPKLEDEKISY